MHNLTYMVDGTLLDYELKLLHKTNCCFPTESHWLIDLIVQVISNKVVMRHT